MARFGVQFTGRVPGRSTRRWFTHSWNASHRVQWMIVPTWPIQDRAPQLEWDVQTERQAADKLKYFLEIRNLSNRTVEFEARYAILD